jgi:hypothetical protein
MRGNLVLKSAPIQRDPMLQYFLSAGSADAAAHSCQLHKETAWITDTASVVGEHYKAVGNWLRCAYRPSAGNPTEWGALFGFVLRYPAVESANPRDILNRLTRSNILLAKRDEVEEYVAHYPALGSLLDGVCATVRDAFGQGVELSLELYKDPEEQDQYLTLYVREGKYEFGILSRIEAVASQFTAQLETVSGHLLVTTDFRRPRG